MHIHKCYVCDLYMNAGTIMIHTVITSVHANILIYTLHSRMYAYILPKYKKRDTIEQRALFNIFNHK